MGRFTMAVEPHDDGVRIVLGGELDMVCAYTFDARLRDVESRGPQSILLDLDELRFVDHAGLGRILAAQRRARAARRPLRITRGSPTVRRVLELAAVDQVLEVTTRR